MHLSAFSLLVPSYAFGHIRYPVRTVYRQSNRKKIILNALIQTEITYFSPFFIHMGIFLRKFCSQDYSHSHCFTMGYVIPTALSQGLYSMGKRMSEIEFPALPTFKLIP